MTSKKVAFLTSANVMPNAEKGRDDAFEFLAEFDAIAPACAARGLKLTPVVWDAPGFEPRDFDALVVGTTWDYWDRKDDFLAALERIEAAGAPLFNPLPVIVWNIDKSYLDDLARAGAPSVATVYADRADADAIAAAHRALGADHLVVKPRIGAGAWRQAKVRAGEPLPDPSQLPPGACLIQPFLDAIPEWGEVSFLFFGGRFSHAVRKVPARGDYRVQSLYGAREESYAPNAAELDSARSVLAAVEARAGGALLYARIDMTRGPEGGLVVMETELIEPYYYPRQGPECGVLFAEALAERV